MLDTSIQVKTDQFDGPLGLLLMLVENQEMDVRKLDLTRITAQYLNYLSKMQELNFDVAGEYLYLAATLLLLKSKSCVSDDELGRLKAELGGDELSITSEAELIRRLEELQRFQKLGQLLWTLPRKGHEIFVKPKVDRKAIVNSILTPMDLNEMVLTMVDILRREKRKYTMVKRDRLSIKEKLVFLKNFLREGQQTDFEELLHNNGERSVDNIVITFISLLELARLGKVDIFQNEDRSNIYINVSSSLENFDINEASGFEDDAETEAEEKQETKPEVAFERAFTYETHEAPELVQ